ncbi:unnamed protein product [Ranitomeya imitator]|uniref:PH domain-containing protein n=1 Tax=Ranitomeya imitator TaxID=111125 RepID=A0ABN9MCQ4_9NEOB|nr:unnamed protein product [Ranitomeya imitator]
MLCYFILVRCMEPLLEQNVRQNFELLYTRREMLVQIRNTPMSERFQNDVDPIETRDWLQAIESVIREEGVERAQYLIEKLLSEARKGGVKVAAAGGGNSDYVNTISVEDEPAYPDIQKRLRWLLIGRMSKFLRLTVVVTILRKSTLHCKKRKRD